MLINMVLPGAVETARLPKEYQEVEYIQSSGTQYIDTGFIPNNNTRVVMDMTVLNGTVSSFFGARKGSTDSSFTAFCLGATSLRSDYGSSQKSLSINGVGSRVIVDADKSIFKYGSYSVSHAAATFNSTYSLYLLQNNYQGSADDNSCMAAMLYSCQIYDNGTLVRDLVPCYRKADVVVGMYDLVYGVFYGNAGTGTFAKGANVSGDIPPSTSNFNFTYTGNYSDNRVDGIGDVTLNTSGQLVTTGKTVTVSVYILGGGGGGAFYKYNDNDIYHASGGGGGNQTVEVELVPGTYDVVIGVGGAGKALSSGSFGAQGSSGGDTTAFGIVSKGGGGGDARLGGKVGTGGTPNGGPGSNVEADSAIEIAGGSPNGGKATSTASKNKGGNGLVRITFS